MFTSTQLSNLGVANFNQALAHEARLNRIHRLFKTHYNVTEPSLVLDPYLFLGNCISAHDVHRLSRLGIRYVLNVAKRDVEVCPYYSNDMRTLTIDLRDDDRENILRTFDQVFSFIDEAKRNKSRILVHCSHGQSRSPAIVIAYLMRTYNVSLEQCLVHVIKARPCVIPNDGFLKQLIIYDRFLVEQRRQRQEAAVMQAVKSTPPSAEIPIQHYPTAPSQSVQISSPTTKSSSSPPSVTNEVTLSSINSSSAASSLASSMNLSSTSSVDFSSNSSVPSSESTNSVRVIPIQVASKDSGSMKSELSSFNSVSTEDDVSGDETNPKNGQLKDKSNTTDQAPTSNTTHHKSPVSRNLLITNMRSNLETINDIQQVPYHTTQSTINHYDHFHDNNPHYHHYHQHAVNLTQEQWDFINNIPMHYSKGSNEPNKTKYITEIYDRATNRFIPTTCCY